jgi:hypothetical protein
MKKHFYSTLMKLLKINKLLYKLKIKFSFFFFHFFFYDFIYIKEFTNYLLI